MRIGVIGTGLMASEVVKSIVDDGHEFFISKRSEARSSALAAAYENVHVADNQAVLDQADVIILGLLPEQAKPVLPALRFAPHHKVVSLMGGVSCDNIGPWIGPATLEAIMIPFPYIAAGASPALVYPKSPVLETLFEPKTRLYAMATEEELTVFLTGQSVLMSSLQLLSDAANWMSENGGNPNLSEPFLKQLVGGALCADGQGPLSDMIAQLSTPGGYNITLRNHLWENGTGKALSHGLETLFVRAEADE